MKNDFKRFDIVLVDFGQNTIDSEQGGKRPAVIIQNDKGNKFSTTTLVMPLSKQIHKNPFQSTHTLLKKGDGNGLKHDSVVLGECMRQISEKRILKYLGSVSDINEKKEIKRVYDANFGEWVS